VSCATTNFAFCTLHVAYVDLVSLSVNKKIEAFHLPGNYQLLCWGYAILVEVAPVLGVWFAFLGG
jgi:hypothetical protein